MKHTWTDLGDIRSHRNCSLHFYYCTANTVLHCSSKLRNRSQQLHKGSEIVASIVFSSWIKHTKMYLLKLSTPASHRGYFLSDIQLNQYKYFQVFLVILDRVIITCWGNSVFREFPECQYVHVVLLYMAQMHFDVALLTLSAHNWTFAYLHTFPSPNVLEQQFFKIVAETNVRLIIKEAWRNYK